MSAENRDRLRLGVVPVGTGNDFVRNFTHRESFFDIDAQLEADVQKTDVIKCNEFYALNMINMGFDCQVVCKTVQFKRKKIIPSKFAYIAGLIMTLAKKPGIEMFVNGSCDKKELLLATFANGKYCGGGFHSNPYAHICNGEIDMLFINDISRTRFVSLVGEYKKGTHISEKNSKIIENIHAQEIFIEFDKPTQISVDGEIVTVESLNISCEKEAINFLIPRGSELKGESSVQQGEKQEAVVF